MPATPEPQPSPEPAQGGQAGGHRRRMANGVTMGEPRTTEGGVRLEEERRTRAAVDKALAVAREEHEALRREEHEALRRALAAREVEIAALRNKLS
eukprot:SAG11_NODE_27466_length_332_cov_0.892704_1_plen_95_part_01